MEYASDCNKRQDGWSLFHIWRKMLISLSKYNLETPPCYAKVLNCLYYVNLSPIILSFNFWIPSFISLLLSTLTTLASMLFSCLRDFAPPELWDLQMTLLKVWSTLPQIIRQLGPSGLSIFFFQMPLWRLFFSNSLWTHFEL